ncbi:MAG: RlmE family RNA methyltransferase [Planctomycetota bacterium]|nr:RlmE family RNA methyltransferase [Planctomycetota bacterium]
MAQRRILHDAYFKKAKEEGYLARSAYKLIEIDDRKRVFREGDWVLDLGCAPGSWLQVAAPRVGEAGRVVGVDLQPVQAPMPPNVVTLVGDVFKVQAPALLEQAALLERAVLDGAGSPEPRTESGSSPDGPSASGASRRGFDIVLSDMAPNTSGHGDDLLSIRLCDRVVELLPAVLRPGGVAVMKVLEGGEFPHLLKRVQARFAEARPFKPDATRDVSKEIYVVAKGYRPPWSEPPATTMPQSSAARREPPRGWSAPKP